MTRHNIPIGRILGIPIALDYSWFLIFGLLTWMLAGSYYPVEFKNWPPLLYWFMGATTAIMLFVSVLLHELGHSVIALRFKVPVRSITLFIFGGVAQIGAEPPSAKAEFLDRHRRTDREPGSGGVVYGVEARGGRRRALVGFGEVPGLHQLRAGAFQFDSRLSAGWRPCVSCRRLGRHEGHAPGHAHRRQHGAVLWFRVHLPRRLADARGKLRQRAMDRLHRLVSRQCRLGAGASSGISGSAGGSHGFAGHEQSLCIHPGGPDVAATRG